LDELKLLGEKVTKRCYEHTNRESFAAQLRKSASQLIELSTTTAEKYAHIGPEVRSKVVSDCTAAIDWLNSALEACAAIPLYQDAPTTCDEIISRTKQLNQICNDAMNKPKPPAPKPAPTAAPTAAPANESAAANNNAPAANTADMESGEEKPANSSSATPAADAPSDAAPMEN